MLKNIEKRKKNNQTVKINEIKEINRYLESSLIHVKKLILSKEIFAIC